MDEPTSPVVTQKGTDVLAIEGGRRLEGSVTISGSKNAALGAMAAALLVDDDCILENVPDIGDVHHMAEVLRSLGVAAQWVRAGVLRLNAAGLHSFSPPS
ncbi:MAG: UDP-N-acetylglucosamine 1-carboxyvinyltransferase, partial [Chloroflexi bacterium]|nr:UDP-N-acetylglucosamine 1-carboxyvinyltransferase [Chloroflexota bacterium]